MGQALCIDYPAKESLQSVRLLWRRTAYSAEKTLQHKTKSVTQQEFWAYNMDLFNKDGPDLNYLDTQRKK